MLESQHRGIATGGLDRVEEQLMVVLRVHPAGVRQHGQQFGSCVAAGRHGRVAMGTGGLIERSGRDAGTVIERCVLMQCGCRDIAEHLAIETVEDAQSTTIGVAGGRTGGDHTDHRGADFPASTNCQHLIEIGGLDNGEHAFLALRGHDLERFHARLTTRDGGDVHVHAHAAAAGGFAGGTSQAGAAEILNADDEPGVEQFETGLDETLLLIGVAHLHTRALLSVSLFIGETSRGEHAHTTDAIATGGGTEQHGEIAHAGGLAEHETLGGQQTETQHIHQRIAHIGGVEHGLATHVGHTHRVAVTGHATHDALGDPTAARVIERTETQRIHQRDRSGAHGEDVAQDAANARGRPLIGLNGRRMVVALDTNGGGDAVAHIDHTGVLAGTDQHPRGFGGQTLQMHPRRLIGAVLGPHHGVHGQFEVVGVAAQQLGDRGVLVISEAECDVDGLLHPRNATPWLPCPRCDRLPNAKAYRRLISGRDAGRGDRLDECR